MLPFDISQSRVIFFDHTDLASAGQAKEDLQAQIQASLSGVPDNPISERGEIKSNIRRRPQEVFQTEPGARIFTDQEGMREYVPPVQIDIPGDLTDEEKAE